MATKVTVEKLSKAIMDELNRWSDEKARQITKIIDDAADSARDTLRRTSPKRKGSHPNAGRYRKGWRVTTLVDKSGRYVKVVHNKTDYQLTHLLEKGHENKLTGRRTPAKVHVAPVEEAIIKEVTELIEEVLEG